MFSQAREGLIFILRGLFDGLELLISVNLPIWITKPMKIMLYRLKRCCNKLSVFKDAQKLFTFMIIGFLILVWAKPETKSFGIRIIFFSSLLGR